MLVPKNNFIDDKNFPEILKNNKLNQKRRSSKKLLN